MFHMHRGQKRKKKKKKRKKEVPARRSATLGNKLFRAHFACRLLQGQARLVQRPLLSGGRMLCLRGGPLVRHRNGRLHQGAHPRKAHQWKLYRHTSLSVIFLIIILRSFFVCILLMITFSISSNLFSLLNFTYPWTHLH